MIKTEFGTTNIEGSIAAVTADFKVIVISLIKSGFTKEEILEFVNDAIDFSERRKDDASAKEKEDEALGLLKKINSLMEEALKKGGKKDE